MNSNNDEPPNYAESNPNILQIPPPSYQDHSTTNVASSTPTSYKIGDHVVQQPLVSIPMLKAHLALLRAFKQFKTMIEEKSAEELKLIPDARNLDKEKRWAWVVGLAIER